ncbi:hypothetical protein HHI36_015282 [Cryptolaemus montrouzieri]|uniref:Glutathione peroxidase n=1 Tax=Cryptolaemus montrouzieri TaxID=559131 RepID=A0ABD2N566_9CUCU
MAPTTRSGNKPKSATLIDKKSPKITKKKSQVNKKAVTTNGKVKKIEKPKNVANAESVSDGTIYDYTVKDIDGNEVSLDKYKGHVCIIVNVASRCGHTKSNYEQFVELHEKYSNSKGLKILAFPCNQFGSQESGTCEKIKAFAEGKGLSLICLIRLMLMGRMLTLCGFS